MFTLEAPSVAQPCWADLNSERGVFGQQVRDRVAKSERGM